MSSEFQRHQLERRDTQTRPDTSTKSIMVDLSACSAQRLPCEAIKCHAMQLHSSYSNPTMAGPMEYAYQGLRGSIWTPAAASQSSFLTSHPLQHLPARPALAASALEPDDGLSCTVK